jgi:mono/diheme cytochrome c family protein
MGGAAMRYMVTGLLLLMGVVAVTNARPAAEDQTLPSNYVPSGKLMFNEYCASCHGAMAEGDGPLSQFLKTPPANLATLTKRHGGKFPREYVTMVLEFGPGPTSHGTSDMPTWGPVFRYVDKRGERAVQQRIKNLCDYLQTLQEP